MKFVILMNGLLELRITETHLTSFTYVNVRMVRTQNYRNKLDEFHPCECESGVTSYENLGWFLMSSNFAIEIVV